MAYSVHMYEQGGSISHGLLVAGLLPPPLGGCEGKISKNRWTAVQAMPDGLNGGVGVGVGVGVGGPPVAIELACRQPIVRALRRTEPSEDQRGPRLSADALFSR
jgi:hypothetical protein